MSVEPEWFIVFGLVNVWAETIKAINQRNWTFDKMGASQCENCVGSGINCPAKTKELFGIYQDIYVVIIAGPELLQSYENNKIHIHGFNNFGFCSRIHTVATQDSSTNIKV